MLIRCTEYIPLPIRYWNRQFVATDNWLVAADANAPSVGPTANKRCMHYISSAMLWLYPVCRWQMFTNALSPTPQGPSQIAEWSGLGHGAPKKMRLTFDKKRVHPTRQRAGKSL